MKKAFKILGVVLLLVCIVVIWFCISLRPNYNGTIDIEHLKQEVNVHYDTYGIPHIYAENQHDAFTALGYVHAQDRLWQMELLRRIPQGRLAEIFGHNLVRTDRFFIALGIDEASEVTVQKLDTKSPSYMLAQAYVNGINEFVKNGPTPLEYYLTGTKKADFTVKDIHNIFGYMAFSFAMAHKTDPLLTAIKSKLGDAYLIDLEVGVDSKTTLIRNFPKKDTTQTVKTLVASIDKALEKLPLPQFIGSNSWVIAPQKTATGKVLFANDPHIGFSQPSVWYEAHVHTPTYEMYGYHLAGTPFPLLGHNRKIAYGMTMFENDDIDFYWEENNPSNEDQYKTGQGWKTYKTRTKTIKVKDSSDVSITIKTSRHGPVLNHIADEITFEQPVAMAWQYLMHENQILEASYKMSHATNQKEFEEAVPMIHAPGLNIMYGDASNNIGWYAVGTLYELPSHANSKFILNGSNDQDEIVRYLDASENPRAVNPPWHFVYSANNQPDSIAGKLYSGYYLPENRAKRIEQLIKPKNNWTKKDMMQMITDVKSSVNPEIVKEVLAIIDQSNFNVLEKEAVQKLQTWNGDNQLSDIAPTIYHKFIYRFLKNTFHDELGQESFEQLLKTHMLKRTIAPLLFKESIWYDDITTTNTKEARKTILTKSFTEAITALEKQLGTDISQWTWNKVHTLEHDHPIGKIAALRSFFNVGPYEIHGTREVINNLGFPYDSTGVYKVKSGPSTRRIIDFSDIENSMSILPTGQSGNPFSPYYEDQATMYIEGKFRKMLLNTEEIKRTSENHLILK